ncbi:MAG: bifunctional precorrin-2 dehydrogenase/sirohydrochlorin ferrochelatase [bacterium]|nr:bifunctional precorrin-2 dehydrogenase/sirohydrochlorin ferrochelatase [bacterium]
MLYPINLDIKKKKCLVIGGGEVALRKVKALLECQAKVTVVSPQLHPEIMKLAKTKQIQVVKKKYQSEDLNKVFLVIGATNDNKVNRRIADDAKKKQLLVNIVDVPDLCNFQVPASIRRGALMLTISTNGKSPALTKYLRKQLEEQFGSEYAEYVERLGEWRKELQKLVPNGKLREQIFSAMVESDILYLLKRGLRKEAELRANQIIDREIRRKEKH